MQKPTLVAMLAKVTSGVDLNSTEAETALDAMMSGDADLLQVSGLLAGLQAKGLAPTEIEGGVR